MASLLSFSLPKPNLIKASSSSSSSPTATTLSIPDTLNQKFSQKGINFLESNNIPVVQLTVRNGSSLRLQIPDAHVTSYKPKVYWKDDGFEEVLYTVPAGGSDSSTNKAKGGIGLVINDVSDPDSKVSPISTSEWVVKDVDSDSIDALQVELSCTSGTLDITYVVSLYPLSMATAVIVKNNGRKPVNLTSAILSHFKFKRRSGAAIQGLKGCSYCSQPPLSSPFEMLSPAEAMKSEPADWFSFGSEPESKPGEWTLQDEPFTILKNKFSRVYAAHPTERLKRFYNTAPSKYETLDQGRELFFRVIRIGYEDIYLSSPGSLSQKYGKDYFICTGPASMLVPVVVNPGEGWRGAQVELINSDSEDRVEVKYIVTLQQDILSSELEISNSKSSPLQLMGSVISHLTVSTPEATYAVGLEGSNFFGTPPFLSNFGIIPPDFGQTKELGSSQLWDQMSLKRFLSSWGARNQNDTDEAESREREREREEDMEGEENDNYKHLTEKMSRIYTSAPRQFTVIDRGRRNSVVVGRDGFDEVYMFSPGSKHECYSKYAYICVGQSAMLKPIILGPEDTWQGAQHLHNPNL